MRVLAAVLAVPAVILAWQWWGDTSTERQLAPVASAIAGRKVKVDCQTFWGALIDTQPRNGQVRFDGSGIPDADIFLTHNTCSRLADFAEARHHPKLDCLAALDWSSPTPLTFGSPCYATASRTIYAILTLAHEAYHTAGVQDEALANCYATQSMGYAASALGASQDESLRIAAGMNVLLPFQQSGYQTSGCTRGSDLDLNPQTPAFPTEVPLAPQYGKGGKPGLASGAGASVD
jgi:hypothetical protein